MSRLSFMEWLNGLIPSANMASLEKQIIKLGREQFKLNTLLEMQQKQFQADLQGWREQNEQHEQEWANLLAHYQANRTEARWQVIERLLPVLDGLDEALASGQNLLARAPSPDQIQAIGRLTAAQDGRWPLLVRLSAWPIILLGRIFPGLVHRPGWRQDQQVVDALTADVAAWQDASLAWLRGLELVRERLLETLALENVHPIPTHGHTFDPHLHRAVDTVPVESDAPPGTIVAEWRPGYIAGDRVLRYAEVVVCQDTGAAADAVADAAASATGENEGETEREQL